MKIDRKFLPPATASSLGAVKVGSGLSVDSEGTITSTGGTVSAGNMILLATAAQLPSGYLLCDGSSINKTTYSDLYSAIGGTYGETSTTFNLPFTRLSEQVFSKFTTSTDAWYCLGSNDNYIVGFPWGGTLQYLEQGGTSFSNGAISGNIHGVTLATNNYVYYAQTGYLRYITSPMASSVTTIGSGQFRGVCFDSSGLLYASVENGDIYTWDGATLTALSQATRQWGQMCAAPNGDIYCALTYGDIYIRASGTGDFTALSQTSRSWLSMCAANNGDIYAADSSSIYVRRSGYGDFVFLRSFDTARGIATDANDSIFVASYNGYVWKAPGTPQYAAIKY